MKDIKNKSDRTFTVIIVIAVILVLVIGAGWYWTRMKSRPIVSAPPAAVSPAPAVSGNATKPPENARPETSEKPGAVVRFDKSDEEFKQLMDRRKAKFGLKDSVDMIVKPGETMEIGGIAVPMEEILEKIRLKSGGMVETDIGPTLSTLSQGDRIDRLYTQLKEKERRFRELEKDIVNAPADAAGMEKKIEEYDRLQTVVDDYHEYRDALTTIRNWELILESKSIGDKLNQEINALSAQKKEQEQRLATQLGLTPAQGPIKEQLLNSLAEFQVRLNEIDTILKNPPEDMTARAALVRERIGLAEKITALEKYEQTLARSDKLHMLSADAAPSAAAKIEADLQDLRNRADELEDALTDLLLPGEKTKVYGIHVVDSGDNIWNIHFQFLKENFSHRGITLSRVADEPDERGGSSGVGKILKFAEGMVYIYNLREHRLADDVSLIHPQSKIIVFNMAKAIELIRELDYEDIKHIQFDGETLWLPARDEAG